MMDTTIVDQIRQELLNGPAMVPPPEVTPNFVDPPNLRHIVIIMLIFYMTLSTMVILMRMYTKIFLLRKTVFEDYVLVLGWLLAIAESVSSGMTIRHGGGTHQWNVQLKTFFSMLYWVNIASVVYNPTLFVIKFSIFLQYLRIFVPSRHANMGMFVTAQVVIAIIFMFYLVDTAFNIFMCRPREKYWNRLQTGSCYSYDASMLGTGFFNVFSDFALLMLPVRSIWKLQVPMKKRLGILAVFATGMLACIVSIVRTYYTFKLVNSEDITHNLIILGFWTHAEITIGIMISCFPVLPRLFQVFRSRIHDSFSSRFKGSGMTSSESSVSKFILASARRMRGKKSSDGFVDLYDSRTSGSEKRSPFQGQEMTQSECHIKMDSSRDSPTSTRDRLASQGDMNDKQQQGHILMTTRIETKLEPHASTTHVSHTDIEGQNLRL